MPEPRPAAGWHPDPDGSGRLRYWDGTAWTSHTAPAGPPPSPTATDDGRSGFWKFWSTLPGVLTGLAALVGAVAGVVVLFRGADSTPDPPSPPATTVSPATVPPPVAPAVEQLDLSALEEVAAPQDLIAACAAGDPSACGQILDTLANECLQGLGGSCDALYVVSPVDSEYELYGATCGFRVDPSFAGFCHSL